MIHPDLELRLINPTVGYGLFATKFIPKGTITYVKDELEIEITPAEYQKKMDSTKEIIDRFAYIDAKGNRIMSWDLGNYVNHCCFPNTMSAAYDIEIAIKDIQVGEQITDNYSIFNLPPMQLECSNPDCRKVMDSKDFDLYYPIWDEQIKEALASLKSIPQPLVDFIPKQSFNELNHYLNSGQDYKSVYTLRYVPQNGVGVSK